MSNSQSTLASQTKTEIQAANTEHAEISSAGDTTIGAATTNASITGTASTKGSSTAAEAASPDRVVADAATDAIADTCADDDSGRDEVLQSSRKPMVSSQSFNLLHEFSPKAVTAKYRPQRLPHFRKNPMIEALPPSLSEAQLFDAMTYLPEFDPEQQQWSVDERVQMVMTLSNLMIPSRRQIRLARTLDSMLRSGYVGRLPNTPAHTARVNSTYAAKDPNRPSGEALLMTNSVLSTLLMGLPGMGKTTCTKTFFRNIPQVIYHPKYNVYQVTHLHVEMPSDGTSITGLAIAILLKLDELVPGANYYQTYGKRKVNTDTLMRHVARLLNQHFVGFLIADEIQNLANAYKGKQTVMTELVSACNDLGVPILFIGTNKAAEVFSLDFRQSRRTIGLGIEHWGRLMEHDDEGDAFDAGSQADGSREKSTGMSEWEAFLDILWSFQWVKNPVELDAALAKTMYFYSQGIIDIAIKLFSAAQIYAITEGIERITPEILHHVYKTEMKTIHKMIDALRVGKQSTLTKYSDIAPIDLQSMAEVNMIRASAEVSDSYTVKPGDPAFVTAIASALMGAGQELSVARSLAETVAKDGTARNLIEGVKLALQMLEPKKTVTAKRAKGSGKKRGAESVAPAILAPDDYRNAIAAASAAGNGAGDHKAVTGAQAHQYLREMGMTQSIDTALDQY